MGFKENPENINKNGRPKKGQSLTDLLNKKLDKELAGQYMFKVIPFPHHVQRENKMLTGAGADRMQTGMQLSFGKATSKAAILKKGGRVFVVALPTLKSVVFVRKIFKQIKSKLPCKTKVIYEEVKKKSKK